LRSAVSSRGICGDGRRAEFPADESLVQQSEHLLFLVLLPAAHVAAPITHFISFEVGNLVDGLRRLRLIARVWRGAFIPVFGMKMVVDVALEVVRAMKPRAGANEDTARKPFRAVVSIGSAAIRSSVIVTVGAVGGGSNVNCDADLGLCFGSGHREENSSKSS